MLPQESIINPNVLKAVNVMIGTVPMKASQIQLDMQRNPQQYPFSQITYCNIGDPHSLGQKPITFTRQVLSCLFDNGLLNEPFISEDVKKRAKTYIEAIGSVGCYTHHLGPSLIRQSICKFIEKEDQVEKPPIDEIILTNGASQAIAILSMTFISKSEDSFMIPVPEYPLYASSFIANGGQAIPYYLNEDIGWQLDEEELERSFKEGSQKGAKIKMIVIANPGNPTGIVLRKQTIEKVIKFAVAKGIIILADEVYRNNIYKEDLVFQSFRRVLNQMEKYYQDNCMLISLHSASKGVNGECGLRGGYMYLYNISKEIKAQMQKLKCIYFFHGSIGQIVVDIMCNPPIEGVSESTKEQYLKQTTCLQQSLARRSKLVTKSLNEMKNIKCHEIQGAFYAFPSIQFSKRVIEVSEGNPQQFYCMEVLKNTGIVLLPGYGFMKKGGSYHFRITTLISEEKLEEKLKSLKVFNDQFHEKYNV